MSELEIFMAAFQIAEPNARKAWLDSTCGDDPALRRRVDDLLKAHGDAGSLLERPAIAAMGSPDSSNVERPGAVIGPYKLLEQIGEGGFGVVFAAEQSEPMRRKVALKVLKPGMDTRLVVARFEAERQALAMMDHPNIARVFDGGATPSGRPYFVMELVRGVPITEYCDQNQLAPRQRLELFVTVCQAVQHAHQKGIIHRDLKPSNVLVSRHDTTPTVKVIDFGVAKALGPALTDKTLFTGIAQMMGTPLYMSPEQAGMSDLDVDTRSDIYSLGVLLYELLTGTTPFSKERFKAAAFDEIRRIIREEEPPKPSTRLSNSTESLPSISAQRHMEPVKLKRLVRGELDWIVMKALEKDRGRRYETANGFAADIRRYLADEPVQARPQSTGYRLRKFARRNRAAFVMGSTVAAALLTTVVALAVSNRRVHEKQLQTNEALEQTKVEKLQKSMQLWESLVAQARGNRLSRRTGQRFETLEVLKQANDLAHTLNLPEAKFDELRNAVIGALTLPDVRLAGPWNPWPADGYSFDFDETHSLYARTDRQGNCSIRQVADDAEICRLPGLGMAAEPHFSRDGRFLTVRHVRDGVTNVAVQLWDLNLRPPQKILSEDGGRLVDFHPNGQKLAVVYNDGAIGLFDLPSGKLQKRLPHHVNIKREVVVALHPTEPVAAVCSYFGSTVQLRDLNTNAVLASIPEDGWPRSLAWHPDGRTLAVGLGRENLIRLYDRATRKAVQTFKLNQTATSMSFNHAADRLASAAWGNSLVLLDVGTGQMLFSTTSMQNTRRFSRDDRQLAGAIQDGKLGILQIADGRECRTLVRKAKPEKTQYTPWMSVSPDGRLLAAPMTDGFGIWDLASGEELDFITITGALNLVLFEPSGSLLVLSQSGLSRWPIAKESKAGGQWILGPPERQPLPLGAYLDQSRDGRVLVTCSRPINILQAYAGGWIRHADRPDHPIPIDLGADITYIGVSPDGRWVVTVSHTMGHVKIWDARDGRLEKQLGENASGPPHFSPDGRWLSTGLDGGRLFVVGTWEPGPQIGGIGSFSPDSKLLAVATSAGVIRLVVPATGQEIARLEDPSQDWSQLPFFTPDGAKLIAHSSGKVTGVRVWDLRLIRQHLAKMDLDWNAPPYPPAESGKTLVPIKLEVRLGDLDFTRIGSALTRDQQTKQDIDEFRRMLNKQPEDPRTCNNLAWIYLTSSEAFRDVKAALPLAELAVRLEPEKSSYINTLGLAYYRNGHYREAVDTLRPNLARGEDGGLTFDLYFLAMSHHKLGELAQARVYFDLADRWTHTDERLQLGQTGELNMFRAEAISLLGVTDKRQVEIAPPVRKETK